MYLLKSAVMNYNKGITHHLKLIQITIKQFSKEKHLVK
jgi:hypothetical protein